MLLITDDQLHLEYDHQRVAKIVCVNFCVSLKSLKVKKLMSEAIFQYMVSESHTMRTTSANLG